MPIRVYFDNDLEQPCTIRPTPLYSIGTAILENGAGEAFGVTHSLTLTGTLLADQGMPFAIMQDGGTRFPFWGTAPTGGFVGPYGAFNSTISNFGENRPPQQQVSPNASSHSIISKQNALRALFAQPGQRLEISDVDDNEPSVIVYPRNASVNFQDGIWVDKCDYTITLECDAIYDKNLTLDYGSTVAAGDFIPRSGIKEATLIGSLSGAFIKDFAEDWSIEVDDSLGENPSNPRSYRISHSLSATGKNHFGPSGQHLRAWEQARKFVQLRLASGINDYPNVMGRIGSGTINLVNSYGGFNHVRSEQISESNGTYSVSENWVIASGTAYENFSLSVTSTIDNPFVNVSIDGNIKGLSQISPSGFGGLGSSGVSAYTNALNKYSQLSNSGQFGMVCDMYRRASNAVAVQLNSAPKSITVGANEYNGELSYNLQFDNRPTNIISGALFESFSINDTYPGDVFAVIPVIGRPTGPILQYIGSRTEYQRAISINLTMDYSRLPYGSGRNPLILKKPSVIEPTATQIANLIRELSPAGEPGVRKYFISPPQENWNPKEGTYSFNLTWTYEMDR